MANATTKLFVALPITPSPAALAILLWAASAAPAAPAQKTDPTAEPRVTVCMERKGDPANFLVVAQAQEIASQMFASIGVRIDWHNTGFSGCPPQGIRVTLSDRTPPDRSPGTFAYALPYEGTNIRLFYDRIAQNDRSLLPYVLAHVLAHEIGHILQGITRHSERGVMKARWTPDDYGRMMNKPLEFTSEDIALIHDGLAARVARSAAGSASHPNR